MPTILYYNMVLEASHHVIIFSEKTHGNLSSFKLGKKKKGHFAIKKLQSKLSDEPKSNYVQHFPRPCTTGHRGGLKSPVAFLRAPVEGTSHVWLGASDESDGAVGGSSWHGCFLWVRDIGLFFFSPAVQKKGCKCGKLFGASSKSCLNQSKLSYRLQRAGHLGKKAKWCALKGWCPQQTVSDRYQVITHTMRTLIDMPRGSPTCCTSSPSSVIIKEN